MSYFDSRVGECPVWQVVLIRVVKRAGIVNMYGIVTDDKMVDFR